MAEGDEVSGNGDHRVVPHVPEWRHRAADLIEQLRRCLGEVAVRIEHIGSTSVEGLAARPIPDIQVSVVDVHDVPSFMPALEALGYKRFRFPELDVDDYLVFVPADCSNTEHIQVCQAGSHQERRHIAVRDYLRASPSERRAYEIVKRDAATRARGDRGTYSHAKNAFVQCLERRALSWAADD